MRKLSWTIVLCSLFYTIGWYSFGYRLKNTMDSRIVELRSQGYEIAYSGMKLKGFPFSISLVLKNPILTYPSVFKAWIEGDLQCSTSLWYPQNIKAFSKDPCHTLISTDERKPLQLNGKSILLTLFTFDPSQIEITLEQIELLQQSVLLAQAEEFFLGIQHPPLDPNAQSPVKILDISFTLNNLSGSFLASHPFGKDVQKLELQASLSGTTDGKTVAKKLTSWYHADGTLDVSRLFINWGPLNLNAEGTFALDEELQPLAAFSTEVIGLDKALNVLVGAQILDKKKANLAKVALTFLADPSMQGQHRASISIQNGKVDIGPVTIFKIPKIKWK